MPSPFPGMDPYLEDPEIWSGVHAAILAGIAERLGPAVRPRYAARYAERVYVTTEDDPGHRFIVPDVRVVERDRTAIVEPLMPGALQIAEPIELADDEVHERSIHVIDVRDRSVVTVIEVLSPTNKTRHSFGRTSFLRKRREVRASDAHWIEVDLLREGLRTPTLDRGRETEYQVYLSRAGTPRKGYVWPVSLRDRLPVIGIPLRGDDSPVPLDLQALLATVIERGSYDLDADYANDPVPPLAPDAAAWARQVIAARRPMPPGEDAAHGGA